METNQSFEIVCQIMQVSDSLKLLGDVLGDQVQVATHEYAVLNILARDPEGTASLSDIKKEMLLPAPSLSRIITRLVQKGYAQRRVADKDSRMLSLVITDAWAKSFESTQAIFFASVDSLFQAMPDDAKNTFQYELALLLKRIAEYSPNTP